MKRVRKVRDPAPDGSGGASGSQPGEVDYRSLVVDGVEGVCRVTLEGRLLVANPALARMFGFDSPAEMIASNTDLAKQLYANAQDRPRMLRQLQEQDSVHALELLARRKDGSHFWISVSARVVRNPDGKIRWMEGTIRDISAQKRAEAALAASEKRLRLTWECSLDGMRLTDAEGRIVMVNQAFCRLMELPREALMGQSMSTPYLPERAEEILRKHRQRFQARSVLPHLVTEVTLRSGRRLVLELSNSFVETSGEPVLLLSVFRDVTVRNQAAEVLRAQDARLRSALEAAEMVEWEWDIPSGVIRYSDNLPKIVAGEATEPYCSIDGVLQMIHPEDRDALRQALDRTRTEGVPFECEYRAQMLDGLYHWILGRGKIVIQEGGKPVRVVGISQEITARKQGEFLTQLQRDLATALSQMTDLDAALEKILEMALRIQGVDGGGIYLAWPEAGSLRLCAHRGLSQEFVGRVAFYPASSPRAKLLEGQRVLYNLPQEIRQGLEKFLAEEGIEGLAVVPLHHDGKLVGTLNLASRSWREAPEPSRPAIEAVGGLAASAIGRILAERRLAASEERFRQVVEHIREVFWMTDLNDERVVYVSPGYEAIWGRSCASVYADPRSWWEAILPEDRQRRDKMRLNDRLSGRFDIEYRVVRPDGTQRWIRDRAFPVRNERGEVVRLAGLAEDITEAKAAERALRESESRYRSLAESSPDMIFIVDREGRVQYVNQAAAKWLGRPASELIGLPQGALFSPEIAKRHSDNLQRLFRAGGSSHREEVIDSPTGPRWLETRLVPLGDKPGAVTAIMGVSRDLTERRLAEETLHMQAQVLEKMGEGVALVGADYRIRLANPALEAMLAWAPGELVGQSVEALSARTPEETAARKQEIIASVRARGGWSGEFRLRKKDGQVVIAESQISGLNWGGQPHFVSVYKDVTERRRLEQQILEISDREQVRVGQDLHDGLCQQLVSAAFDANALAGELGQQARAEAKLAERIAGLLDESITESRRVARGLYPVKLEAEGLSSALKELAAATAARAGIACHVRSPARLRVESHATAIHLYRIAQEALNNAVKHSGARKVVIELATSARELRLEVRDDGRGMAETRGRNSGMGLHIMDYRARSLGGALSVANAAKGGLVVSCCVPRKRL